MSDYREKALQAFGEVCMNCGANESIEIHHLDGQRNNNSLENLITLCGSCHNEIHNGWPKSGTKLRRMKVELGVKVPEPVFTEVVSQSEIRDVSPGKIVLDWMEKAEKYDKLPTEAKVRR